MITSKHILLTLSLLLCNVCIYAAAVNYSVRGKVIDKQSRQPVAYANVVVAGIPGKGASTDSLGIFRIEQIPPGIYRFETTLIGYKSAVTSEYLVSASTPFIEIEIEEDENMQSFCASHPPLPPHSHRGRIFFYSTPSARRLQFDPLPKGAALLC